MKVQKNGEDDAWVNKNNMNMQIEGCIVNTPREKSSDIGGCPRNTGHPGCLGTIRFRLAV